MFVSFFRLFRPQEVFSFINKEFKFKKVGDILNLSGRDSILKISNDASMWTAINAMVRDEFDVLSKFIIIRCYKQIDFGDLHRVPIVNRGGETVGLLAQFDVIRALHKFIDENDFGLPFPHLLCSIICLLLFSTRSLQCPRLSARLQECGSPREGLSEGQRRLCFDEGQRDF